MGSTCRDRWLQTLVCGFQPQTSAPKRGDTEVSWRCKVIFSSVCKFNKPEIHILMRCWFVIPIYKDIWYHANANVFNYYSISSEIIKQADRGMSMHHRNGPLARSVKLRIAHAADMPGTFSSPPTSKETVSKWSRHASRHVRDARAVMHVGIANPRWRGKCSRHFRRMRNPQFYVSGKRPIAMTFDALPTRKFSDSAQKYTTQYDAVMKLSIMFKILLILRVWMLGLNHCSTVCNTMFYRTA